MNPKLFLMVVPSVCVSVCANGYRAAGGTMYDSLGHQYVNVTCSVEAL